MSARRQLGLRGIETYAEGLRTAVRENATAYGYSIMITSSFGVVAGLEGKPPTWHYVLFALGASTGFPVVLAVATKGLRKQTYDAERSEVIVFTAILNTASVLAGVGAAAALAWALRGWAAWLGAPLGATIAYLAVNGVEYTVAEEEEEGKGGGSD